MSCAVRYTKTWGLGAGGVVAEHHSNFGFAMIGQLQHKAPQILKTTDEIAEKEYQGQLETGVSRM